MGSFGFAMRVPAFPSLSDPARVDATCGAINASRGGGGSDLGVVSGGVLDRNRVVAARNLPTVASASSGPIAAVGCRGRRVYAAMHDGDKGGPVDWQTSAQHRG
jgi:hypothetical protein